jgi:hypothetical protein
MDVVCAHSLEAGSCTKDLGLNGHYFHDVMLVVTVFLWKVWRRQASTITTLATTNRPDYGLGM